MAWETRTYKKEMGRGARARENSGGKKAKVLPPPLYFLDETHLVGKIAKILSDASLSVTSGMM